MRLLIIILCLIVPIFCQPGFRQGEPTYEEMLEKLKTDLLVTPSRFSVWPSPYPIYPHSYENYTRRGYTRLKVGKKARVVIAKLGITRTIIGLAEKSNQTYYLVPFVEYAPIANNGIERLKMEIEVEGGVKSGKAYEILQQTCQVHPLFFEPIEKKYHFKAIVVEYKGYNRHMTRYNYEEKFPRTVGTLPPAEEAERRAIYLARYPDTNPRRVAK